MSYAWESFSQAMRALAGNDTQRERLLRAYTMHLTQLRKKDIPAEIRDDFDRLVIEIRRCSVKEGGNLKRIADNVDDHEVASMIDSVIRMYDAVTRYQPLPGQHVLPAAAVWPLPADGRLQYFHDLADG